MLGVPLWSVLCAFVIVTLAMKDRCKVRAALLLLADWLACTVIAVATGSQYLWWLLIVVDFVTAILLLQAPVTRWQSLLGLTYVAEILAHTSFGIIGENDLTRYNYWYCLHYLAWAQAALVLVWIGYDGGHQVLADRRRHVRGLPSVSAMLIRMGKRP